MPAQLHLRGQPARRHAVDKAKIDRLGLASLLGSHGVKRDFKDFGGGRSVHISPFIKGLEQPSIRRQMGHNAQFDL